MAIADSLRSNNFIWAMRIVQLILALSLIGTCVSGANDWHDLYCSTPSRLAYHIAMGVITLFPLIYFLAFTGPVKLTKYWHPWVQIGLDSLFVIFWIAAASVSNYDCDGLCSACPWADNVWSGSLSCYCSPTKAPPFDDDDDDDDDSSDKRSLLNSVFARSTSTVKNIGKATEKAVSISAKKGLDAGLIFLFLVTLLTAIYFKYKNAHNSRVQAAATSAAGKEESRVEQNLETGQTTEANPTGNMQTNYAPAGYDNQTMYGQNGYDPRYGQIGYGQTSYNPSGYKQTGYDQAQ